MKEVYGMAWLFGRDEGSGVDRIAAASPHLREVREVLRWRMGEDRVEPTEKARHEPLVRP